MGKISEYVADKVSHELGRSAVQGLGSKNFDQHSNPYKDQGRSSYAGEKQREAAKAANAELDAYNHKLMPKGAIESLETNTFDQFPKSYKNSSYAERQAVDFMVLKVIQPTRAKFDQLSPEDQVKEVNKLRGELTETREKLEKTVKDFIKDIETPASMKAGVLQEMKSSSTPKGPGAIPNHKSTEPGVLKG